MIGACEICDAQNVEVSLGQGGGLEAWACAHCSGHPEDCQKCGGFGDFNGEDCARCKGSGQEQEAA